MAPFCANDFVDPIIDSPSSVVLSIKDEALTPAREVSFEELCESFALADHMFGKQNGVHPPFRVEVIDDNGTTLPTDDEIAQPTDAPAPEYIGKDGLPYFKLPIDRLYEMVDFGEPPALIKVSTLTFLILILMMICN